jgi:hypothetical protein
MVRKALFAACVRSSARPSPVAYALSPVVEKVRRVAVSSRVGGDSKATLRIPRSSASLLRRSSLTRNVAPISIAVPHDSPSPWAKCASPAEKRASCCHTGNRIWSRQPSA